MKLWKLYEHLLFSLLCTLLMLSFLLSVKGTGCTFGLTTFYTYGLKSALIICPSLLWLRQLTDQALRRSGCFDAEIEVTTPNEHERLQIVYTRKLQIDPNVNLQLIVSSCNGYIRADLEALCREAAMSAVERSTDSTANDGLWCIREDDWKVVRSIVGLSIARGVTVEIPEVSKDDTGGLNDFKKKLQKAVEWPIEHSSAFSRMGMSPIRGILLRGPPGVKKQRLCSSCSSSFLFLTKR